MASSRPGGHGGQQGGGHHDHDLSEEERQELKAKVLGVIKAILVAATKAGIHVEKFNREYRDFQGGNIPHRRLGYSTLEDFLDQNPAVCRIVRKPDGWYVYGRPTEEDAHISRMITAQKSSSKRKAKPKPAPRPRFNPAQQRLWSPTPGFQGNPAGGYNSNSSPHHQQFQSNNRGGYGGQNNQQNSGPGRQFNNSAANRRYPGGSGRFPGGAVNGTSGSAPGGGNRKQQQQQQQKLRTPHANSSQMNMFQNFPPPSMPPAAMHQTPPPPPSHQGSLPPHQMGHHQPPRHQTNNNQPNRNNKNQQQQKNNQQQNKPKNTPSPNSQQLPSDHYRQMLAGWLRGQGCEPCAYETSPVETKASGGNSKGGGKGGKIVKRYLSTVIVSGKRYQTFPEEFPTADEAEEAVSKIACQKLNINRPSGGAAANNSQNPALAATSATSPSANRQMSNGSSSGAPHGNNRNSSGTDFGTWSNGMLDGAAANGSSSETLGDRVVQRIVELVGSRTNGVWSTQIEVEYSRKFKGESLPEKWPAALERLEDSMAKLRVDRPIPGDNGRCIILPKLHPSSGGDAALAVDTVAVKAVKTPQPSPIVVGNAEVMPATAPVNMAVPPPSVPPQSAAAPAAVARVSPPLLSHPQGPYMGRLPPPLTLPTDTLWDVYVTWVNSTTNVRLRILGDNYSALFDELATNMELHYFEAEKMTPVEKPVMGKLYAAKVEGDWHRVEVTHVDPKTPKITCYFIDHGDEDLFGPEDLRELDPKFLDLAPQAKQVRLAHLEDWKDSSEAQAELSNMALGKSLVAQLQANDENGVSLILWDTSGDDRDVNINAVLRDKLCGHNPGDGITFDDMPSLESFVSGGKPSSESGVQPGVTEAVGGATATATAAAAAAAPAAVAAAPVAPMDLEQLFAMDLSTFKPLVQTHPPNIDDFFDISVTLAASPSNFTVQSYADEKNLDDLQRDINSFYGDSKNHHPESPLKAAHLSKDSYFAGKHSDNIWYRVKVNSMLDENTAAVKMVDFGDFAMIPLDQLQPLWPRYRNLPMQAINACLADIVAVNGDWSPSDTVWFTQRVLNKQFVSKVKDVVTDNTDPEALSYGLSVSLFDTSDPDQDIVIDKELVDQGRAVYLCLYRSQMNPNYESRVR